MNIKRIWLTVPALLLPYIAILSLLTVFTSTDLPISRFIMEVIFCNNGLFILAFVFLFAVFAIEMMILCFAFALKNGWDPLSLAKTATVIKLLQIPAYLITFVMGILMLITIFTFAFSFLFLFIDCLTLTLTGLISISSIVNARRSLLITKKEAVVFSLLQFLFVADVISAIVLFSKLSKAKKADA